MRVQVKNLSGNGFEIELTPQDTIADVKRAIETVQGADVYPAARQMLFHRGEVLTDNGSTLEENEVTEKSFIVVTTLHHRRTRSEMKVLVKNLSGIGFPIEVKPQDTIADVKRTIEVVQGTDAYPAAQQKLFHLGELLVDSSTLEQNKVTGESCIVVIRAKPRVPPIVQATESAAQPVHTQSTETTPTVHSLFLVGHPPSVEENNEEIAVVLSRKQIQALGAAAKVNLRGFPSILQELGKQDPEISDMIQDPELRRVIQDHEADFLRFLNGPVQGREGNARSQQAAPFQAIQLTPFQAIQFTPQDYGEIGRLEALGFRRAEVLYAYFISGRDGEHAEYYLLEYGDQM